MRFSANLPRRLQKIHNVCTVIQDYLPVVSRRLRCSKMYIMCQSILGYFRINTLPPSAPTYPTTTFEMNSSLVLFTIPWSIWAQIKASQEPPFILVGEVWGREICNQYVPSFPERGPSRFSSGVITQLVEMCLLGPADVHCLERIFHLPRGSAQGPGKKPK